MDRSSIPNRLGDWYENPVVIVPLTGVVLGVVFHYFHGWFSEYADALMIIVIAFLVSDAISVLFIRGGGGIFQITILGTETQPKGVAFLAFFITIIVAAIIVDSIAQGLTRIITQQLSGIEISLAVGLILAILIYADMNAKFYAR